ncbi:MAG: GNAT family N-acetyltransferase [Thaumarchaeota archaeon]|nr:GNAT family N-acetyltransferase [Nitrososphaerota archaeon]
MFGDRVAGWVPSFTDKAFGKPEVTYWIGKECWGKGIATGALKLLLDLLKDRPIYAHVTEDNLASRCVPEKSHFRDHR